MTPPGRKATVAKQTHQNCSPKGAGCVLLSPLIFTKGSRRGSSKRTPALYDTPSAGIRAFTVAGQRRNYTGLPQTRRVYLRYEIDRCQWRLTADRPECNTALAGTSSGHGDETSPRLLNQPPQNIVEDLDRGCDSVDAGDDFRGIMVKDWG